MEILKDFGIQPVLLLAQIVNFIILLLVLKKFLYRPILKQLENRKKQIIESEKQAKQTSEILEKVKKQEQLLKTNAQKEAELIIAEARDFAKLETEQIINQANLRAQQIISAAKAEIEAERQIAIDSARREISSLVVLATNRLTGKLLSKPDQIKLVENAIKEADIEQKKS